MKEESISYFNIGHGMKHLFSLNILDITMNKKKQFYTSGIQLQGTRHKVSLLIMIYSIFT